MSSVSEDTAFANRVDIKTALGPSEHLDIFIRAVTNILNTDLAELTYAQIVDGIPLTEVAYDSGNPESPPDHPSHDHTALCDGVLDKLRELRENLDLSGLRFDSDLLHSYRSSAPGSRQFNVRLVELAAVAIHNIAVQLHQLDTSFHKVEGVLEWLPDSEESETWPEGFWPRSTLFCLCWYDNPKAYPHGVSDMSGYWAEARIFGGVVLFDRREPSSAPDVQPNSVWFHPDRSDVTTRIVKLNDEQKLALIKFLTSESLNLNSLPILPDENNLVREDSEEPAELTGICRDIWERTPWHEDMGDDRLRDV